MLSKEFALHWTDVAGIIGVLIYIGSYFCLQAGLIGGRGYLYPSLNAAAALSVLLSLLHSFNLSSAIIQITFIAISIFGIIRFYIVSHGALFSEEEQAVRDTLVPKLHRSEARRLLKLGTFRDVEEGAVLTTEGASVPCLYLLVSGVASVSVNGRSIASLGERSMIGEMAALSGAPASATVTISAPGRVFEIGIPTLSAYLQKNDAARQELQGRFATQISEKLLAANQSLAGHSGD